MLQVTLEISNIFSQPLHLYQRCLFECGHLWIADRFSELTAYVCANKYKIERRKVCIGRLMVKEIEGSRLGYTVDLGLSKCAAEVIAQGFRAMALCM